MKKTTQLMEELNGSDDINSFLSNNKDSLDRILHVIFVSL